MARHNRGDHCKKACLQASCIVEMTCPESAATFEASSPSNGSTLNSSTNMQSPTTASAQSGPAFIESWKPVLMLPSKSLTLIIFPFSSSTPNSPSSISSALEKSTDDASSVCPAFEAVSPIVEPSAVSATEDPEGAGFPLLAASALMAAAFGGGCARCFLAEVALIQGVRE